jgi:dihydroflavonol-4-reductase
MSIDVVTGATGHLGNVLVRELLERGSTVRAIVQPGDDPAPLSALPVKKIEADIRDRAALRKAFTGATRVFHLESMVSTTWASRMRMHEVNVGGTQAVISACQGAWVSRLVHMGSVHALAQPRSGVLDETAGFDPSRVNGPYAKTRAEACAEVQSQARAGDLDAVLVLPTSVVGPLDMRVSEVGKLLLDLEAGRIPFLSSAGHDWIDVRDVAKGTVLAAERGQSGEAYLLGGERLTLLEFAELVSSETGAPLPKLLPPWLARALELPAAVLERFALQSALLSSYVLHALSVPFAVSHEKARRELGLVPGPVRQALKDAISWHRAHRARVRARFVAPF